MYKIWVDDVRKPSKDYDVWMKSVTDTIHFLHNCQLSKREVLLDLDHDAGDYAKLGGDYYKILDWCEAHNYNPVVHFHSMNPVGVDKMRQIAQRNHWLEV